MTDRGVFMRMMLVVLVILTVWVGLGFRLFQLHLGKNGALKARIAQLRHMEKPLLAGRGAILDANRIPLALNAKLKNVWVDPHRILLNRQGEAVSLLLANVLGLDRGKLSRIINQPDRYFEYIKRNVNGDQIEKLQRMKIRGVYLEDTNMRYYPHGSMLCHVLGFTSRFGESFYGIEQRYHGRLKGRSGLQVSLKDAHNIEFYDHRKIPKLPEEGCTIELTIDLQVQYLVEEVLKEVIVASQAQGAWAVVQEVKTGRILAMASHPYFDPNTYQRGSTEEYLNRVIGYTYEPGSTMKAMIFAAALNEKVIDKNALVDCENGCWYYRNRPLRDYHAYGLLSMEDVLKKSSNIGTAKIALLLGEERLENYLRSFGIGSRTGIDLPREEPGIFWPRRKWDGLSISRIPMGHGVAVTALQMVNAYSAIANDGFLMRPQIIDRILNARGGVIMEFEPEVLARPIRGDTAQLLRRLLKRVTEDGGTARRARVPGYDIAGKTGTAEKVVNGRYARNKNIASFAGFIPAEHPELSVIVVVDEPKKARTGGVVAAPAFRDICEPVVRYLNIPPGGVDAVSGLNEQWLTRSTPMENSYSIP